MPLSAHAEFAIIVKLINSQWENKIRLQQLQHAQELLEIAERTLGHILRVQRIPGVDHTYLLLELPALPDPWMAIESELRRRTFPDYILEILAVMDGQQPSVPSLRWFAFAARFRASVEALACFQRLEQAKEFARTHIRGPAVQIRRMTYIKDD